MARVQATAALVSGGYLLQCDYPGKVPAPVYYSVGSGNPSPTQENFTLRSYYSGPRLAAHPLQPFVN
jgi:hypothetical protein